jgi:hypothetical protein
MRRILTSVVLSLALVPMAVHADVVVRAGKTVKVKYKGTDQKGVVSTGRMNAFIHSTNKLLASRGLTIAEGQRGVEEVSDQGVRVRLVDGKGHTSVGLVKTELMATNVAISPQAAEWNLSDAVEVRIKK